MSEYADWVCPSKPWDEANCCAPCVVCDAPTLPPGAVLGEN